MKKQPEITERTRQKFVEAFWSLMREKPVSKIAVNEITRRAGYNRSTFYEYFLDIDDLLAYIETKLLEDVKQTILQFLPGQNSLEELFCAVFMSMNEKIYLLMGANGDSAFITKVREELAPIVVEYLPLPDDIPNFDYLTCFVNAAMFSLLQHWNETNKDLSAEEVCEMMQNLLLHGLQSYFTAGS